MNKLRRHRGIIRGATTRLRSEASKVLWRDTLPSSADLQKILDALRDKDSALVKLDKQTTDVLDREEFGEEAQGALECTARTALPKLRLPVLNDENCELRGFWEHYEATIHTHLNLTGIGIFKYLTTYLSGTANQAIERIRLTEANNNIAVKHAQTPLAFLQDADCVRGHADESLLQAGSMHCQS
ncbi:hypothetical protein HPB51_029107 [Rhipicephalus microplus]|uniref:Tick transposon n=1 Tax=Rhipicephalus microplus TaxID=6941 RepID=A0A9J6CVG6_RHIMP|nr:hypothetical protein HPB51_029107 [Rhipicephalus microplus]